jgi:hypothetical protein
MIQDGLGFNMDGDVGKQQVRLTRMRDAISDVFQWHKMASRRTQSEGRAQAHG